jgi:dGTPase
MARENQRVKDFLYARLYSHQNVNSDRTRLTRAIRSLFTYYLDYPRSLPAFYFQQSRQEPLHRVVCDYIAGMTDHYLLERHSKVMG